jgi:hypothetical protein
VCRHYLDRGRRTGRYWSIGDVNNTPGRSLYVRLRGPDSGPGAAGHWTDCAIAGQYGDLLDLIRLNCGFDRLADAMAEARSFLALPRPAIIRPVSALDTPDSASGTARRLFQAGCPIAGTPAEAYLRARGITGATGWPALRYHPAAYYREHAGAPLQIWPALLAAVTDDARAITGILRTWLDPRLAAKAPVANPRKALGHLLGHGVRFGEAADVLAAGEGIETVLALKSVLPLMPMIAGLSASHLAALNFAPAPRRLYIARDNDAAGIRAANRVHERGLAAGIEVFQLVPETADFNADLCQLGPASMLARLMGQIVPQDRERFITGDAAAWSRPA